jgi:hypothetical protein
MAWQIVLGKEKEDTYSDRWVMRRDKDWSEQWEDRVDHLLTPSTLAEQQNVETAEWLTQVFQPATVGAILPILAGIGLVLAALGARAVSVRMALVPGLAGLAILLASAALDGPVPRYRYPLDPLIALFAAGAVTTALGWVVGRWRRPSAAATSRREPPQDLPIGASAVPEAGR